MKVRYIKFIIIVIALSLVLLAGCSDSAAEDRAAYRKIGIDCMEAGDYEGAVAAFNSALRQSVGTVGPDELDICYYKAAAQYAGGDMNAAMETYNAVLDYKEDDPKACYLRGCLYLKLQNAERAKEDFDNAVKYNADDFELYINIYENLSGYGLTEDGEAYLKKALTIKGSDVEKSEARGKIYYLLGQYDDAIAELSNALKKNSVIANFYLAGCYEAMGDTANAESYYQVYLSSGNADAAALGALGKIMLDKGDYVRAISYLEQGLLQEEAADRRAMMKNLVIAYEYSGDFSSAWRVIEEYVDLYPEDADAQREYIFLKNRQQPGEQIEGAIEPIDEGENPDQGTDGTDQAP